MAIAQRPEYSITLGNFEYDFKIRVITIKYLSNNHDHYSGTHDKTPV